MASFLASAASILIWYPSMGALLAQRGQSVPNPSSPCITSRLGSSLLHSIHPPLHLDSHDFQCPSFLDDTAEFGCSIDLATSNTSRLVASSPPASSDPRHGPSGSALTPECALQYYQMTQISSSPAHPTPIFRCVHLASYIMPASRPPPWPDPPASPPSTAEACAPACALLRSAHLSAELDISDRLLRAAAGLRVRQHPSTSPRLHPTRSRRRRSTGSVLIPGSA